MSDITNRIVQSFNYESDSLISNIDENIQKSREIFKNFDEKFGVITNENWNHLMRKAICRKNEECSICFNRLEIPEVKLQFMIKFK